ncbi:MAG: GntR family transcriptional regulator [Planctomycetales bacterium]|nr:GntR family transcriptional regulator [Planctomycetales bacterium]
MIEFKITPGGNRPIYQQVVDQVRAAIVSGELSIGDPLPSVRGLAQQLVVNHNTVAKAFAELVRDGTLESRQGRGVFVAKRRNVFSASERKRRMSQALDVFLAEMHALDCSADQIQEAVASRLDQLTGK